MDRAKFLAVLGLKHDHFRQLVDAVGFERMHLTGVSGAYSVKDLVAHLAAYEQALVRWLKPAKSGRVYVDDVLDGRTWTPETLLCMRRGGLAPASASIQKKRG